MSVNTPKLTQEEQACFEKVSKVPEAERQSVFASTCSALKEHSRDMVRELLKKPKQTILGATLLGAQALAPVQAGTPAPQETQKVEQTQNQSPKTQETFDISKVPEAFKENINIINSKIEEGRKTGVFTTLDGFKESDGTPNSLASSLSNAPDVPFRGLTSFDRIPTSKQLKEKNMDIQAYWEELIKAVFDVNGDKSWLTKGLDRKPLSKEELDKYIEDLKGQQERYINKPGVWLAEGDKGLRDGNQTINMTMAMLGYCVDNGVIPKTEARRRCVTSIITILNFATLKEQPSEKDLNYYEVITDLSNQAGEFLILTQKGIHLTRLVISGKTYTFPSDEDIANHPVLSKIPLLKGIGTKSLTLIGEKLKNNGSLLSLDELNAKLVQVKEEAKQVKEEAKQVKEEAKQVKEEANDATVVSIYSDKVTKTYFEIINLTKEYNNHKNDSTGEQIKQELLKKFDDINKIKSELEKILNNNKSISYKKEYEDLLVRIDTVLKIQQTQKLG